MQVLSIMNKSSVKERSNTLNIGFIGALSSIDPYPVVPIIDPITLQDRIINRTIFDRLFDFDQSGTLINNLADSYSPSTDYKTFTFNLKKGILWSDGIEFTSSDISKSFDLIRSQQNGLYYNGLNDITLQVKDKYQVVFTLKNANSFFAETLVWPILPSHIFNSGDSYNDQMRKLTFSTHPVTTSQWNIQTISNNAINFVRNNKYSRPESQFSYFNFKSYESKSAIDEAIKSRDIDLYFSNEQQSTIDKVSEITPLTLTRQYYSLYFNFTDTGPAWARDLNIRQALAFGVNKAVLLNNDYKESDGPLPSVSPFYNKDIETYAFNKDKAGSLLDNGGYKLINGVRSKDNQPLKINITVQENTPRVAQAKSIQGYWQDLGIQVNLDVQSDTGVIGGELTHNRFVTNVILPHKFDVVLYGIESPPGADRFSLWHGNNEKTTTDKFSNNIGGYRNSRIDLNLENTRIESDPAKRATDFTRFQKILTDDVAAIFLYSPNIYVISTPQVEDLKFNRVYSPEDLIVDLYDLIIDK